MNKYVIAVDLGGTNIRVAAINTAGEIMRRISRPCRAQEGKEAVIELLLSAVEDVYRGHQCPPQGIGIGAAGAIDLKSGTITQSPNLPGWDKVPLKKLLTDRLPFRATVFMENDANAAALGEYWKGSGEGTTTMVCLTLGTGIGGGVIVDGRLLHGADGMASELGHITIDPHGPTCNCGNTGCLEALASATAIRRRMVEALRSGQTSTVTDLCKEALDTITAKMIADAARGGDAFSRHVYREMGTYLGIGLATLINVFNPEKIIIGGQVAKAWDLFIDEAKNEIANRALRVPGQRAKLLPAQCGDDAGLIGAAYLVFGSEGEKEMNQTSNTGH